MSRLRDWITGKTKPATEAEAEQRKAEGYAQQLAALDRMAGPEPIKRTDGKARPGEAWLPSEAARMQDMHDNPRPTKLTLVEQRGKLTP